MKIRILFVDDEPNLLSALRRMFHDMRDAWEMDFAVDGRTGLAMMVEQPYDVVVADMRMPGMDGAMFLRQTQIHNPGAIRIVLSGHSDRDMILQTVRPAHQFLRKPCQPEELKAVMARCLALREVFLDERVKNVVARLDSLPAVPRLYAALLDVLAQEEPSMAAVAGLIAQDVGMAAGVLKLVNSAFFGLRDHVSSPARAVNLLGLEVVKALVLGIGLFGRFDKEAFRDFDLEKLWSHCLGTAPAGPGDRRPRGRLQRRARILLYRRAASRRGQTGHGHQFSGSLPAGHCRRPGRRGHDPGHGAPVFSAPPTPRSAPTCWGFGGCRTKWCGRSICITSRAATAMPAFRRCWPSTPPTGWSTNWSSSARISP